MKVWLRFPAFFYGLAYAVGIGCYYGYFFPLVVGLTADRLVRAFGFYLLVSLACLQTHLFFDEVPCRKSMKGCGYLKIQKVRKSSSPFYNGFNYQGRLVSFVSDGELYNNIFCYSRVDDTIDRPLANVDYFVHGELNAADNGRYFMSIDHWEPVLQTHSLAETRLVLKDRLRRYLKSQIKDKEVYWLFASLATGEVENPILSESFRRVGLSHVLAISGLHYSFIMMSLGAFFSLFLPRRGSICLLLIMVSLYFYFIGESPSLNRAWMAANVFLVGVLLNRKSSGLNALGVALLLSLIIDPFCITSLGFQLSYLATFAILALYPSINELFGHLLLIRSYKTALCLSRLEKHVFIIGSNLRRTGALTLAVSLSVFPLAIFTFGSFPIASIIYNLLVPMTITVTLLSLVFGLSLPFIGPFILRFGEWYSRIWMDFVMFGGFEMPVLVGTWFSKEFIIDYLVALILAGLSLELRRYELTIISRRR